ncbi:MAG: hypothetical protein ABR592_02055 [Nitriliruptorales bacterium]
MDDQVQFDGTYVIHHGTGLFKDLQGQGTITGVFQCLPPILQREGAENCEELGVYSDFRAFLRGTFSESSPDS